MVYKAPKEIKKPINDWSKIDETLKAQEKYRQDIIDYCAKNGKGKYAGKTIKFPVADSHAEYVILNLAPIQLVHVDTMDEWEFQYIDNLTAKDIKEKADQQDALAKLFA